MLTSPGRRFLTPIALIAAAFALAACSSFSNTVADTWPTWAGGMPKDVPPRPGAPGYEEFIAHQQRQDVAAPNGAAAPAGAAGAVNTTAAPAGATTVATAPPATDSVDPRQLPPAYARPDDPSTTHGGLY